LLLLSYEVDILKKSDTSLSLRNLVLNRVLTKRSIKNYA